MTRSAWALLLALFAAGPASAQEADAWTSDGTGYRIEAVGRALALRPLGTGETLFLGPGCEAFAEPWGFGTWGQANGGFLVTLPGREVGFPRQELPMPSGTDCPLE